MTAESFVPPTVGVGNPAEAQARRRRGRSRRRRAADRRDLRDAGAVSQRHGAARDRRRVGRRPAVDRHAEPGRWPWRRGASPGCSASRPRTSTSAAPSSAAASARRASSSGPQVLGILAAQAGRPAGQARAAPRADVRPGRPPRADPPDACASGIRRDGALTAIDHHTRTASSTFDDFFEPAADVSHTLYASPAIATSHEAVRLDTGTPLFMRAPGEATGSIALESAIDEAA